MLRRHCNFQEKLLWKPYCVQVFPANHRDPKMVFIELIKRPTILRNWRTHVTTINKFVKRHLKGCILWDRFVGIQRYCLTFSGLGLRIEATTPPGLPPLLRVTLLGLVVIIIFLSVIIETEYSISTNNHRRKSFHNRAYLHSLKKWTKINVVEI